VAGKKKVSKKKAKKKAKKKSVSRKKVESKAEVDPDWINPKTFDPEDMPELTEKSFIYVSGSPKETGRPSKTIVLHSVMKMASYGCTEQEIGSALGMFKNAMTRAKENNPILPIIIQAGRDDGTMSLRRIQHKLALAGSERMLIWLGQNRLNQAVIPEKPEEEAPPLAISFEVKPAVNEVQTTNARP